MIFSFITLSPHKQVYPPTPNELEAAYWLHSSSASNLDNTNTNSNQPDSKKQK